MVKIYPSDLKIPDSEPHILFQFKEKTQRNDLSFPSSLTMKWDRIWAPKGEFNWLSYCVTDF
jgi:hypothetical protein